MSDRAFLKSLLYSVKALEKLVEWRLAWCSLPEPKFVSIRNATVTELTHPLEDDDMTIQQEQAINISGDAPFGYLVSGIQITNRAGAIMQPQPDASTIEGSSDDTNDPKKTTITMLSGQRAHIKVDDSRVPGDVVRLSLSASATGAEDDAVFVATYVADRVGAVDVGGMTLTEATEMPEAPPAPVPTPDPAPPAEPPVEPPVEPAPSLRRR